MTLIACLHPRNRRTIIADALVSGMTGAVRDVTLPSRAYISPERLVRLRQKPVDLRRKAVEINSRLYLLWAGNFLAAQKVARAAIDWFGDHEASPDDVVAFKGSLDVETIAGVAGIIVPAETNWTYNFGDSFRGNSPNFGQYTVAGTGAEMFRHGAKQPVGVLLSDGEPPPIFVGLTIANDLLAQEIWSGAPIDSLFGGAYEVIIGGEKGFEKADDIVHLFASVSESSPGNIDVVAYPHLYRQWYEGDSLMVSSMSTPELTADGLGERHFEIPSILSEKRGGIGRQLSDFGNRPNYICVSHRFERQGRSTFTSLVVLGKEMEKFLTFELVEGNLHVKFSSEYRSVIAQMADQVWKGT